MFGFSKHEKKQRTMLDDVQEVTRKLTVRGYRRIASQHGCAPTAKTTDDKIMEIHTKVCLAFSEAGERRGERIPADVKNFIVLKFLQLYEMSGEQFMGEHLGYEIDKYLREG